MWGNVFIFLFPITEYMDDWVVNWVLEQKKAGRKCLEVKKLNNNYYVYNSTTCYDRQTKKAKKISKYLGKLDPVEGFVEPRGKIVKSIKTIWQYGNAMLLNQAMNELIPALKEGFDATWKEIYALALVRATGYVPLKRVEAVWERLYDVHELNPNLDPKNLGRVLKEVGLDREGQNEVFQFLSWNGKELVYDLSSFFTRSDEINLAEKGYNKEWINLQQINLALLCSADTGLPTMIRAIPGSVKDIATLINSLEEIGLNNKTLILDRGFFSDDIMKYLEGKKISYVLPTRRNSELYNVRIHLNKHFFYRERLIKCGKRKHLGRFLYLYEDTQLKLEEEKTLYKKLNENRIIKTDLNEELVRSGKILIVSSLDIDTLDLYLLNKKRDSIEKLFDTYKTTLNADRTYLQDDASIFGHVFTAFLSLYAYCKLEQLIKKVNLIDKYSPADILEEYSKVYIANLGNSTMITEIPKKVKKLDETLKANIFPK